MLRQAAELGLRAPELTMILGERAAALAEAAGSDELWVRAESLVVAARVRLGLRAETVGRAVAVLRATEAVGDEALAAGLRADLALCARSVGVPLTGLAVLRPVLDLTDFGGAAKAAALCQLVGCLSQFGRKPEVDRALNEADQLCHGDDTLDGDGRLLSRALLRVGISAHRRRHSDVLGAADAARTGLGFLEQLDDPSCDGGVVRVRLILQLVCSLLDRGDSEHALEIARQVLDQPVRAASVAPVGWLRMAVATRILLPSGSVEAAAVMLRDGVHSTERHGLPGLATRLWGELAHVEERLGRPTEAIKALRESRAAEHVYTRARRQAVGLLSGEFGNGGHAAVDLDDILSATPQSGAPLAGAVGAEPVSEVKLASVKTAASAESRFAGGIAEADGVRGTDTRWSTDAAHGADHAHGAAATRPAEPARGSDATRGTGAVNGVAPWARDSKLARVAVDPSASQESSAPQGLSATPGLAAAHESPASRESTASRELSGAYEPPAADESPARQDAAVPQDLPLAPAPADEPSPRISLVFDSKTVSAHTNGAARNGSSNGESVLRLGRDTMFSPRTTGAGDQPDTSHGVNGSGPAGLSGESGPDKVDGSRSVAADHHEAGSAAAGGRDAGANRSEVSDAGKRAALADRAADRAALADSAAAADRAIGAEAASEGSTADRTGQSDAGQADPSRPKTRHDAEHGSVAARSVLDRLGISTGSGGGRRRAGSEEGGGGRRSAERSADSTARGGAGESAPTFAGSGTTGHADFAATTSAGSGAIAPGDSAATSSAGAGAIAPGDSATTAGSPATGPGGSAATSSAGAGATGPGGTTAAGDSAATTAGSAVTGPAHSPATTAGSGATASAQSATTTSEPAAAEPANTVPRGAGSTNTASEAAPPVASAPEAAPPGGTETAGAEPSTTARSTADSSSAASETGDDKPADNDGPAITLNENWLPRLRLPPSLEPFEDFTEDVPHSTSETHFTSTPVIEDDGLGEPFRAELSSTMDDDLPPDAGLADLLARALAEHQAGTASAAALVKRLESQGSDEPRPVNGYGRRGEVPGNGRHRTDG
ncbi:hypothetical protein [Amycolatopsis sp.]|uniref:hypothetical protein n=1 Tax=Amycolatopsis sp. TaxID=37632 RepID=UPI0039C893CB